MSEVVIEYPSTYRELFQNIIKKKKDHMTRNEFVNYYHKLGTFKPLGRSYIKWLFDVIDQDGNGSIEYNEFCIFSEALNKVQINTKNWFYVLLFYVIDKDQSNAIELDEFIRLVRLNGINAETHVIQKNFEELSNKSDHMTLVQFLTVFHDDN